MARLVEVAKEGELADGAMKKVDAEGKDILLARVGEDYYAVSDKCPHLGASLSGGTLEGTVVTCPRHGSQFDLTDGHMVRWTEWSGFKQTMARTLKPPRGIDAYEVKVEGGAVIVSFP